MKLFRVLAAGLVALALVACERANVSQAAAPASVAPANHSPPAGRPQPKLATIKLWLGPHEVAAEQALTEDQIRTGMMFRKEMGEYEGMLFVFDRPTQASFWMRNTLLPLSCAYIDPEGIILEIRAMKPLDETPLVAKTDRVQYVLEMNQGWFERNKITTNMLVRTERGSLRETYFRR